MGLIFNILHFSFSGWMDGVDKLVGLILAGYQQDKGYMCHSTALLTP